jgi:3-oxoacyl-[acyl-carrier protein] reductase
VVIASRTRDGAERAAARLDPSGVRAVGRSADVTDKASVAALFDGLRAEDKAPDILVYNTGGPSRSGFFEATDEEYAEAHRELVLGFSWCVRAAVPAMAARHWGRIISLGSLAVKEPHREARVLHNLNRVAAVGLSKSISNEVGRMGITVNTIGTGNIGGNEDSGSHQRIVAFAKAHGVTVEEEIARRVRTIPMGRIGEPEELGALCAFLCSTQSGYITGQTIMLDGGQVQSPF